MLASNNEMYLHPTLFLHAVHSIVVSGIVLSLHLPLIAHSPLMYVTATGPPITAVPTTLRNVN